MKTGSVASSSSSSSRKKYPVGPEFYQLREEVGRGASASVYKALCIPFQEIVAVKILDFEHNDPASVACEVHTMVLVDHPNVSKAYCSFASNNTLWVVMPYMDVGSCLHVLKAAYPNGFQREVVIATILREALNGLVYLHDHGFIHRDVKAGNILLDTSGGIQLGDLGVSACLFDRGGRQHARHTFTGTPCWMAPEVMDSSSGYDFKADIWSFGITALELAHGNAPFSKYPPQKVLLMTLQNPPPCLDQKTDKRFSKSFRQMIALCLVKDPSKRPSAKKLLKHPFFKNGKSNESIVRTILEGLPSTLEERMDSLKMKEANLMEQKILSDGKKEEMSDKEYKRGISAWKFEIDDIKEQASLIEDFEAAISQEDLGSSQITLHRLDMKEKPTQCQASTLSRNGVLVSHEEGGAPLAKLPAATSDGTTVPETIGGLVVQQRGRFKVISEEEHSSPVLQRIQSVKKLVALR
ncbi:Serine/threonine-protein kinase fray2 [Thalictrum thalictroides]|uniref:Serine/threonine-protein kinase fray2 n=1 Tax=Thalictrum thalictroides TaxID=46969 RepID=A0A7J6WMP3_THATH|nr:Serine/threonine-protein kinase fray2 [Thalictrum thalictroides]